jgi:CDP-paratose 2-epimerase
MKLKKVFITGGAGFIGANMATHYLQKGVEVTSFDNLSRPGVESNIKWLKKSHGNGLFTFVKGDVRDFDKLKKLIQGHQAVFHFAGQTAVTTSVKDPRSDFEANALGTLNVLESVRQFSPKTVVLYASSNKVYGAMSRVTPSKRQTRYISVESPSIDESEQLDFYSPYGCSKGTGDQYTHDYARIYGLKTIVFRQSCIYGTHQFGVEDQGWVAHFASQAIKNEPITIFGDGKQVRDMLFITDLAKAYDQCLKHITHTSGQIYNIGGGIDNALSLLELISFLEVLLGRRLKLKFAKERFGDQKVYISNIDKAKRDFNWRPEVSVDEGLKLLYFWLRDYLQ